MADGTRFSDFEPLAGSAGPTADEASPITFGNPAFQQRSIADRETELDAAKPNTGNWDMITVNETADGEESGGKGRFLFTVYETGQAGVQRHDLATGQTDTIWISPSASFPLNHVAFDACFWTPWGTLITAEESWTTAAGGSTSPYGRLFEFINATTAPGIFEPVTPTSNDGAIFVHQNVVSRVSHEGIQFDSDGNMYFIDELNGGCLYKFTSAAKMGVVKSGQADYFAAGQAFVLRVGDGNTPNATGAYTWVPFTDENGAALPGALTITDVNGVTSVDGRNTTDLAPFKGTDYQRPEDMQIQRIGNRDYLYVTTTTTHEVYRLDLKSQTISVFANRNSIDLATGLAVGTALSSPDNLAIDHDGNIYIVEDRSGGVDNDIWFANDLNQDGDLLDADEGLARWASNGTVGSEFTGLYFDPKDKRRAWVNIQHPDSDVDRTIEITIPVHEGEE
ncbi:MAG: PhoX family protein [Verrucomicrobiales bacterium]|nr:PhoX family protein [Verrucomicrobiales bacterium]